MSDDPAKFLSEILSIPIGDMIASVGQGVATAQAALDAASLKATLDVYSANADEGLLLLRTIGYQPQFYVIPKASGRMTVALSMFSETTSTATSSGSTLRLMASPLNATTTNKCGYTGSAGAEITFDIVPVPPNEQIRQVPNVVGVAAKEAASALNELGLSAAIIDGTGASPAQLDGLTIKTQSPAAGTIVKMDSQVSLTV